VSFLLNRRLIGLVFVLFVLFIFPYLYTFPFFSGFLEPFRTFQAMRFGIVSSSWLNLLTGYSGQISLGHGAFVAVGAYLAAIFMNELSMPVFLAVLCAGLATGVVGFLIGVPALRLSGPYLAIATLALVIVLPQILKHDLLDQWTGGVMGISLQTPHTPDSLGDRVTDDQWLYLRMYSARCLMMAMAWALPAAVSAVRSSPCATGDRRAADGHQRLNLQDDGLRPFGSLCGDRRSALHLHTVLPGTRFVRHPVVADDVGDDRARRLRLADRDDRRGRNQTMRIDLTDLIANNIPRGEDIGIEASRGALWDTLILSIIFTPRGVAGSIEEASTPTLGPGLKCCSRACS
jgi:hypothetical protein